MTTPTFEDLLLSPELVQTLSKIGYEKPTEIQAKAIPLILAGRDVVACAQTGTGKTASFALPMIDILQAKRARARMPRSLVLVPTRELAQQVATAFEMFGGDRNLGLATLIGGESVGEQEKVLSRGVDILIATPGRFLDLVERGKVLLSDLKCFVLDEADRMLDMGFMPDIEKIMKLLPRSKQTLLFSATLPPPIRKLVQTFIEFPKELFVAPPSTMATTVEQFWLAAPTAEKLKALLWLLEHERVQSAFIFCNRKRDVDKLYQELKRRHVSVMAFHGDMSQSQRQDALTAFRESKVSILVASDVAARGIDIKGLSHVINYDVPVNPEDYVHRIGRTGRAGEAGRAFTLAAPVDRKALGGLERMSKGKLIELSWRENNGAEDRQNEDASLRDDTKKKPKNIAQSDLRSTKSGRQREGAKRLPLASEDKEPQGSVLGFGNEVPSFFLRGGPIGSHLKAPKTAKDINKGDEA